MDFKIDKDGFLSIKRGNKFKEQLCPLTEKARNCGDWCPLFGEPHKQYDEKEEIFICKKGIMRKLIDES